MSPTPATELFHYFRVELDAGPNALFEGGDRVAGHVKIKLKRETVIQVIRIQFKGRSALKEKKGHEAEKVIFDKDYVLLERPPGKPDAGHFQWKADFDYSLPFEFVLPLGCPSSFESSDAFVRYFARASLQTCEDKSPVYIAKCHFSIYDAENTAAIDPKFQEPYTNRKTFSSAGCCCCCKRKIYVELTMPKRVFYAGEDVQAKLIVDNVADEKIAENISYKIVQRVAKTEVTDENVAKHPARVLASGTIDGKEMEKNKNTVTVGQLTFPGTAYPTANAIALTSIPRDKSTTQFSPDEQANKLFDHPSIISQSRKEPLFNVHYALQVLLGKFLIEVPFVVRPAETSDAKKAFKKLNDDNIKYVPAIADHELKASDSKEVKDLYPEPDEKDKHFVGEAGYSFQPLVPVYQTPPNDEVNYQWPSLGTFGPNNKLIWHPDRKVDREKRAEEKKREKELAKEKKEQLKAEKKKALEAKKAELAAKKAADKEAKKKPAKEVEIEPTTVAVADAVKVETEPLIVEGPNDAKPEVLDKKQAARNAKKAQAEAKKAEAEAKKAAKEAAKAEKEAKKAEELAKKEADKKAVLDAKKAAQEAKKAEKEAKKAEQEAKKQEKNAKKNSKKDEKTATPEEKERLLEKLDEVPEIVESIIVEATQKHASEPGQVIVETHTTRVVEQHGDQPVQVTETVTITEQCDNEAPVTHTYETEHQIESGSEVRIEHSPEPQATEVVQQNDDTPTPIIEEIVVEHPKTEQTVVVEVVENGQDKQAETNGVLETTVPAP